MLKTIQEIVLRIKSRAVFTIRVFGGGFDRLKADLTQTKFGKSAPVRLVVRVVQELGEDDATHMAASISYYAVLSLFPLVLGLTAIVGVVADSPSRQKEIVDFIVEYLPGSEEFVTNSITGVVKYRGALGIASILGMLWAGSAVFGTISRSVNRAWDIHRDRPFLVSKPRQIAMALLVGVLVAFSLAVTSFLQWATTIEIAGQSVADLLGGQAVTAILKTPALLITFGVFLAIYKYIPNTLTYWRYIWLGALVAGILFEVAKNLFVWYLENFAGYNQLYGNVASIVVLMVWIYFSAFILILGAEIASEFGRMKRGIKRGQRI